MGRLAGFIALNSGIAGSADVILIPEIPFDINKVCDKIRRREAEGRHFSIVVVAEGAAPKGGTVSLVDPSHERLGGIDERDRATFRSSALGDDDEERKSTRLNSSHTVISY